MIVLYDACMALVAGFLNSSYNPGYDPHYKYD